MVVTTSRKMKIFKRKETFILIIILIIAAFFRLYKIRDYIVFLGDEGRDVLVVKKILQGDLTFLGPTASVGGFYLGPIYYYMMAPFLWLSNYDPAGPAYMVAIIGIATVYLVYRFGKKFFHPLVGLSAAFLYSISPLIVRYSRASWNPNPLPFFSLLGIYWLSVGLKEKKKLLVYLAGACLGVAWQLHYLALILNAVYGVIILNYVIEQKKAWLKNILLQSSLTLIGWLTTFSPFLAFEIYHHFPNTRTILEFISRPRGAVDLKLIDIITTFYTRITRLFYEIYSLPNYLIVKIMAVVSLVILFFASRHKNKSLLIWFFVGLLGMSLYQGDIHNYYYGFLFPVPYLITGIIFYLLWSRGFLGKIIAIAGITCLSGIFWQKAFFQIPPNKIIDQTKTIAQAAISLTDNQPYNFALIAPGNSDHAYRYFLETLNHGPKPIEEVITEQLIIICEQRQETCQPLGNPLWEIAGFGRAEIVKTIRAPLGDVSIFKLVHHPDSLQLIGKPAVK